MNGALTPQSTKEAVDLLLDEEGKKGTKRDRVNSVLNFLSINPEEVPDFCIEVNRNTESVQDLADLIMALLSERGKR